MLNSSCRKWSALSPRQQFFSKIVRSLFAIFLPFVLLIAVVRFEDVITVDTGVCLAACVMMSVILECLVIVTIILVTPVPRP